MLRRVRTRWNYRQAVTNASRVASTHPAGEKDVVVLPCWRRPEFLWHCLDNLTRADGIGGVHVLFRPDTGFSPENLEVIDSFAARLSSFEIDLPQPCPFRRTKQSGNLLLGYLRAAAEAKQYVFLLEEDVMVGRDYFRWHRAAHAAAGPLFCSIAVKNPNRTLRLPDEAEGYYLSTGDYCSSGVCFDKHVVRTMIAPHVNMAYFRRPKKYLRRHFPASAVGLGFVEQDGLLRRIQEQSKYPIAYPCVPRAFDAGFYGYNRPGGIGGSIRDRIKRLANTIYNPAAMRNAVNPEFIEQCVPVDLQPPHWSVQRRIDVAAAMAADAD
jgi:hypothetical protein